MRCRCERGFIFFKGYLRKIAGFRDVMIHDYLQIDLDEVWDVIERNLPALKQKILQIIPKLEDES